MARREGEMRAKGIRRALSRGRWMGVEPTADGCRMAADGGWASGVKAADGFRSGKRRMVVGRRALGGPAAVEGLAQPLLHGSGHGIAGKGAEPVEGFA